MNAKGSPCRVLIVDSEAVRAESLLDGLKRGSSDFSPQLVASGAAAIEHCRLHAPEVLVIARTLQDFDGIDLADEFSGITRNPCSLLLLDRIDDLTIYRIFHSRLSGAAFRFRFGWADVDAALEAKIRGGVAAPLEIQKAHADLRQRPNAFFKILSEREIALLGALGLGFSDQEVADVAKIAPATVHAHRRNIMAKIGVHSRSELMRWAQGAGFVNG